MPKVAQDAIIYENKPKINFFIFQNYTIEEESTVKKYFVSFQLNLDFLEVLNSLTSIFRLFVLFQKYVYYLLLAKNTPSIYFVLKPQKIVNSFLHNSYFCPLILLLTLTVWYSFHFHSLSLF